MSGVELLFIDGGATVTAVLTAGAARLGFKQAKRDDEQFLPKDDLEDALLSLKIARDKVNVAHRTLTQTWRGPVSLFGEKEKNASREHGVPIWAMGVLEKAQRLADESAKLDHFTDNYIAQFERALQGSGEHVLRKPVHSLIEALDLLWSRLSLHTQHLALARKAFDSPQEFQVEPSQISNNHIDEDDEDRGLEDDAQLRIVGHRKRLGEMWNSTAEVFHQIAGRGKSEDVENVPESQHIQDALERQLAKDEWKNMKSCLALAIVHTCHEFTGTSKGKLAEY
jgi:hypothetical protein